MSVVPTIFITDSELRDTQDSVDLVRSRAANLANQGKINEAREEYRVAIILKKQINSHLISEGQERIR